MDYYCHRAAGFAAAAAGICLAEKYLNSDASSLVQVALCLSASSMGCIIPDIDSTQSVIGKRFPKLSGKINRTFRHRGITHYPVTLLFICLVLYIISVSVRDYSFSSYLNWCFYGFVIGYASHIVADLFNRKGVRLLSPFSRYSFRIPSGIDVSLKRKKKIGWRYLKGGGAYDTFVFVTLCCILMMPTLSWWKEYLLRVMAMCTRF